MFIALGVVFGTLAVPLGLDARWTSAAWAIEGAGIYWIAIKQNRRLGRAFATLVQFGAALAYLGPLDLGDGDRLLSGSRLGAAMVAAALLSSFWQLHRVPLERHRIEDRALLTLFTFGGLFFLALVAPLSFGADGTAIAWALLGLAALATGLQLGRRPWLVAALLIQGAGGLVFLFHLHGASGPGAVLESGLGGLFVATLIGASAMACAVLLARSARAKADPVALRSLALLLLFGLGFLNLAVLFVLPWGLAGGVWAASGVLILVVSLRLQQWMSFGIGLVLQLLGGIAFLIGAYPALHALPSEGLTPLAHTGFWTPVAIALAAFIGAWRLLRDERQGTGRCWAGWISPCCRTSCSAGRRCGGASPGSARSSASCRPTAGRMPCCWSPPRPRCSGCRSPGAGSGSRWPCCRPCCCRSRSWSCSPAMTRIITRPLIWATSPGRRCWPCIFACCAGWASSGRGAGPMHSMSSGCWLGLAVLALEIRWRGFILLSDRVNAWRWLGWASVPAFYLLAAAQKRFPAIWPVTAFELEYRAVAALPVALILLAWFWLGALFSDGDAAPLPYVPLVNPLELGQMLALFALLSWFRERFTLLPWAARVPASIGYWVLGPSALLLLTGTVLRTAHHWAGVPYTVDGLLDSMLVQASLSMLWAITALGLMIFGHARALRVVWLTGATLVAIVVIKLFLVELTNTGGLPRIISFIGVGILLLITGYFAPLPPKRPASVSEVTPT